MVVPNTSAVVGAAAKAKAPAPERNGRSAHDTTTPRTTAAPADPRPRRPRRPLSPRRPRSPRRLPRARALTHPTGLAGQQDMIVPLTSARVGAAAKAKAPAPEWNGHSTHHTTPQDTTTPRTTAAPAGPHSRRRVRRRLRCSQKGRRFCRSRRHHRLRRRPPHSWPTCSVVGIARRHALCVPSLTRTARLTARTTARAGVTEIAAGTPPSTSA